MVPALQPDPAGKACAQKTDLTRQIAEIQTRMAALYRLEAQAMVEGDRITDAIVTDDLDIARKHRTDLLAALQEHIERHGC